MYIETRDIDFRNSFFNFKHYTFANKPQMHLFTAHTHKHAYVCERIVQMFCRVSSVLHA